MILASDYDATLATHAEEARQIEDDPQLEAAESRRRIVGLIAERYTAGASGAGAAAR